MKYENKLFNLSAEAYNKMSLHTNVVIKEESNEQSKLLKILFEKFKEELESQQDSNLGILRVKFIQGFWKTPELGYTEISRLVKNNTFNFFANQYCIYLGNVENNCDERHDAYYEIIWDYKTYFEQLSEKSIDVVNQLKSDNLEVQKALRDFQQLPAKHQINILNSFVQNVRIEKKNNAYEIAINTCSKQGHIFDKWKHNKWITYVDTVIDHQHISDFPVEHENWERTCSRCGFIDKLDYEPQELIDARNKKNKQKKIKRLERELKRLKEDE